MIAGSVVGCNLLSAVGRYCDAIRRKSVEGQKVKFEAVDLFNLLRTKNSCFTLRVY